MNPEILAAFSTASSVEEIHNCLTVLPEQQTNKMPCVRVILGSRSDGRLRACEAGFG